MASAPTDLSSYDRWFRDKVQAALDDPRPPIAHAEVEAYFHERRVNSMREIKKRKSAS